MTLEAKLEKILELGAYKAAVIDVEKIPFDEGLRRFCEVNHCGHYGKNYSCPPHIGDVETVIAEAKSYQRAIIYQTVTEIENSYDFEGMMAAAKKHSKVSKLIDAELQKDYSDYLMLTAGGCDVCKVCAVIDNEPCRFPEKAVSSVEAYCIDVSLLDRDCGMKYVNGTNTVTYFGAFLFK